MTEQATTANKRSNIVLRRTLPTLLAAFAVWALVSSFLALDITEYGLVTRFGRVVRVLAEPGLHVVAPFDRVVRLDKRILFFRPALSEYLTIDKKNLGVDSLVTWRIADPVRFLAAVATPPAASSVSPTSSWRRSAPSWGGIRRQFSSPPTRQAATTRPWRRKSFAASQSSPELPMASMWSASTSAASTCRN